MALCIKPRISLFRYVTEQTRHRGVRVPDRVPLAEASTNGNFQALLLPPPAMPTKPVSPSTDLDRCHWNRESTNCMPSPMVAKGDSRGMKQKAAGKKSLPNMTPRQAITNLDNLAVRMVIGPRPS
jgi:hypothetical protein